MTSSIRTWVPAGVLIVGLAVGMVATAVIASGRPPSLASPSPATASPDPQSPAGATAPIRHHSEADAAASTPGSSLDLTNSPPITGYTAPQVRTGALARLQPGSPPVSDRGLAAIEAPRGTPVHIFVRPIVDAEGTMTVGGGAVGNGHTEVIRWHLNTGSTDGPPGQDTPAGTVGASADPVLQQWDSPDRLGPHGAQPYLVVLDFTVRTRYPDGQTRDYDYSGVLSVRVGFAASSG